jgi:hypothetical protein
MYTSKIVLIIFITLTVWWSIVNLGRLVRNNDIPTGNVILQTIGIVGIVAYFL